MKKAILCLLILTGCVQVLPDGKKGVSLVRFAPKSNLTFPQGTKHIQRQIVVEQAQAPGAYDTSRILYFTGDQRKTIHGLDKFIWEDPLPELLQNQIIQDLRGTKVFKAVSSTRSRIRPEIIIVPTIGHFEIDGDEAVIKIDLDIVHWNNRKVFATKSFEEKVKWASADLNGFYSALTQAWEHLRIRYVRWLYEKIGT